MNKRFLIIMGFSAASFTVGATTSYFLTRRELEKYFVEQINVEVAAALLLHDQEKNEPTVTDAEEDYQDASFGVKVTESRVAEQTTVHYSATHPTLGKVPYNKPSETVSGPSGAISGGSKVVEEREEQEGWLDDLELPALAALEKENEGMKESNYPHIIAQDDYERGEEGFESVSYTYYAGDLVLVDETDEPVSDHDEMVGTLALDNFGFMAEADFVYVKNPTQKLLIEIMRDTALYKDVVLGQGSKSADE